MGQTVSILARLEWVLFRRLWLRVHLDGFSASLRSNVSRDSTLSEYTKIYKHALVIRSSLGRFSYLNVGARLVNCRVGSFCSIGPEALIGGLGRHPTRWISTHPSFYSTLNQAGMSFASASHYEELAEVTVCNDVWIGARAVVLDGVTIGNGAIIGAGAGITRDVEPYSVVAGVPARLVRKRFSDSDVALLEEMQWWNWPVDKLREMAPAFLSDDPKGLLPK
jgi:acetyltransferase-like isoleucine patch superfamily enzyme